MPQPQAVTDPVAAQYERWVYPLPVDDLSTPDQQKLRNGADPKLMGAAFWPKGQPREDLRILVAGCGTVTAARYAYQYPQCQVVGFDISETSLNHQRKLQEKHGLKNLTLLNHRVETIADLGQTFDLIDASGMLHHLPTPLEGMKGLAQVLDPQGVIFVMVYGLYGRTGVYQMQRLFQILGTEQTEAGVNTVKAAISALKTDHPLQDYLKIADDLAYDAGIVDTFLHPQDVAFTVQDCLELVEGAGLVFQGWMDNFYYTPTGQIPQNHPFFAQLSALSQKDRWQAMELMHGKIAKHCFFATHSQRPREDWELTFAPEQVLGLIPVFRHDVRRTAKKDDTLELVRPPFPTVTLHQAQGAILAQVDGKKTIAQCLDDAGIDEPDDVKAAFCQAMFKDLWQLGFLHFRMA